MLKLSGKKIFNQDNEVLKNQLKILYPQNDKRYALLLDGKPYDLKKDGKYLIWNIPSNLNKHVLNIKLQAMEASTGKTSYVTNEIPIIIDNVTSVSSNGVDNFDSEYPIYDMKDEHKSIPVIDRKITMPTNYQTVVCRDNVSQLLTFEINRYYDGVDLYTKACGIKYINAKKMEGKAIPVNIKVTPTKLNIGWLLDYNVTLSPGIVRFAVEFLGYDEDNLTYVWQTVPAELKVENGLWVEDIEVVERYPSIIEDIQIQLKLLESMINDGDVGLLTTRIANLESALSDLRSELPQLIADHDANNNSHEDLRNMLNNLKDTIDAIADNGFDNFNISNYIIQIENNIIKLDEDNKILVLPSDIMAAENIIFNDGESLQWKIDNGLFDNIPSLWGIF